MAKPSDSASDAVRYELFDQLDRLEELLEDMIAFDVTTRDELERRIEELNAKIDALDDELP
jgi:polyhydroxyalkanoate synthesis regulator phasin